MTLFAAPSSAPAASFTSASGQPAADIIANPNDIYTWDEDVITWKMSSGFKSFFSDPLLQQQARLAFAEWQTASASQARRDAPRYSWVRWNANRNFYDLRSVITHEVGHTLGAQHADAAWFNNNYQLNFHPDGNGGWEPGPPLGGEIMNEGNDPGFMPAQKSPKGMNPGSYWRTLSKDELYMLDYSYNRHLDFVEVDEDQDAMITLNVYNVGGAPGTALGNGGPDTSQKRDPNDAAQGRRITKASANFNAGQPIGMQALTLAWEFTNQTGKTIDALSIRTEGTNNRNPLAATSQGTHRFAGYEPSSAQGVFDFENVGHHFINSEGGGVPNGSTVQVVLTQDVWDWYSTSATAHATDDSLHAVDLVSVIPWDIGDYLPSDAAPAEADALDGKSDFRTLAAGFRLVAADQPTVIGEIGFAPVAGLGLTADDLTSDLLPALQSQGKLTSLVINPITLAAGGEYYIVLEGHASDLPPDVLARGNYLEYDFPGAYDESELLVYARNQGVGQQITTFALLNTPPILGHPIPEPVALILTAIACLLRPPPRRLPRPNRP
jgi:hypothetical protein